MLHFISFLFLMVELPPFIAAEQHKAALRARIENGDAPSWWEKYLRLGEDFPALCIRRAQEVIRDDVKAL